MQKHQVNYIIINNKIGIGIGHNAEGNLIIIQIDGLPTRLNQMGIGLHDFANLFIKFGAVNAINLGFNKLIKQI
jgi:exopolysaccharide biosynthesis protein